MPWNQLIGTEEEVRTKEWLRKKGFSLINQNWTCCHGEVDIIASFLDQLHFIAVATKECSQSGMQDRAITRKRMVSFKQAAQRYLERHPLWKEIIFDVLTISVAKEDANKFILIEDIRTA
jgi:putative endonuclease